MHLRHLMICTLILAGTIRLDAGASGGGGTIVVGTVTAGPGASFQQFDYAGLSVPAPFTSVQGLITSLPGLASALNALLAGPTDGTNVLNNIGFSNGASQFISGPPSSWTVSTILQAAAASNLLGGLDPAAVSITNVSITSSFVQIGPFVFATVITINFTVSAPVIPVAIMIKPSAPPPVPINPGAKGTVPVAILSMPAFDSTPAFDASTQVDRTSLTFGHAGTEASLSSCNPGGQDVNGDGLPDLVCHFYNPKTAFASGDTRGFLQGKASGGFALQGSEAITIVP